MGCVESIQFRKYNLNGLWYNMDYGTCFFVCKSTSYNESDFCVFINCMALGKKLQLRCSVLPPIVTST